MPTHVRNDEPTIDRKVRAGDVAIDQAQGTWVYVMEQVAPDVATWNRENDSNLLEYAGNWQTGATLGDRVFAVVYLGGNGVKSYPSGSYDFPESRLARYAVEEANEELRRPQVDVLQRFITRLFARAKCEDFDSETGERSGDLADSIAALAEDILPFSPLGFDRDLVVDVLEEADAWAEEEFQDELERWERSQEPDADQDAESDQDDAQSDGGDDVDEDETPDSDAEDDDVEPEIDPVEVDLGEETVDDPDDSAIETETNDEDDAEEAGDDVDEDDGLGDFQDFDA